MEKRGEPSLELPCGCRGYDVDDTFIFEACEPSCQWAQFVIDESKRQGKPVTKVEI